MCPYGWGAEERPHQPKIAPKLNYTPGSLSCFTFPVLRL